MMPLNKKFTLLIKAEINIHHIKYTFGEKKYVHLLYDSLNSTASLRLAIDLKDLNGIVYISSKYNLNYTHYLYNVECSEYSKRLAFALHDKESLELLCSNDYRVTNYQNPEEVFYKLYDAINMGDMEWVRQVLLKTPSKTLSQAISNPRILDLAYHKQYFEIATLLINAGAKFTPLRLVNPNLLYHQASARQHLVTLYNKTDPVFLKQAESIIATISARDVGFRVKDLKLPCSSILKFTYTDGDAEKISTICSELVNTPGNSILNVLYYTAIANLNSTPLKIFFPLHTNDSYFQHTILEHPYVDPIIHLSYQRNNLKSEFIHELSHSMFYRIFYNEAKVYDRHSFWTKDKDFYSAYQDASYLSIKNVLDFLEVKVDQPLSFEQMVMLLKNNFSLNLIYWYVYHQNKGLSNPSMDPDRWASDLYSLVSPRNSAAALPSFTKVATRKSLCYKIQFLEKIVLSKKWTDDEMYVLHRIYEFSLREAKFYDVELLVRLAEFKAHNIDKSAMKLLDPLMQFEDKHVTPLVKLEIIELLNSNNAEENSDFLIATLRDAYVQDIIKQLPRDIINQILFKLTSSLEEKCFDVVCIKDICFDHHGREQLYAPLSCISLNTNWLTNDISYSFEILEFGNISESICYY